MPKKLELWEKELSPDKIALIKYVANEGIRKEIDRINKLTEMVLDSCYVSAMSDNLDLRLDILKKIVIEANVYMDEVKEYINKNRGEYFMKIEDEKLMEQVRKDVIEHIKNGSVKSKVLNELKKKYKLTPNVISDIWLEVKEKEYTETCPSYYLPNDAKNKAKSEEKDIGQAIASKREEKGNSKAIQAKKEGVNMFEVVESRTVLKGSTGIFEKTNEGVKDGEMFFKDINETEKYETEEIAEAQKHFEETISKLRRDHAKKIDAFSKHMNEVKAVFAYKG